MSNRFDFPRDTKRAEELGFALGLLTIERLASRQWSLGNIEALALRIASEQPAFTTNDPALFRQAFVSGFGAGGQLAKFAAGQQDWVETLRHVAPEQHVEIAYRYARLRFSSPPRAPTSPSKAVNEAVAELHEIARAWRP